MKKNETGMLFSPPMVNALLEGRKTQTRRLIKQQPLALVPGLKIDHVSNRVRDGKACFTSRIDSKVHSAFRDGPDGITSDIVCPYGIGQTIWVRETWQMVIPTDWEGKYVESVGIWEQKIPKVKLGGNWRVWYGADLYGTDEDPSIIGRAKKDQMVQKWRPSLFMPRWASRIDLEVVGIRAEQVQDITEKDAAAEGVMPAVALPGDSISHVSGFAWLWDAINHKRAPWDENPWVWVIEFKVTKGMRR